MTGGLTETLRQKMFVPPLRCVSVKVIFMSKHHNVTTQHFTETFNAAPENAFIYLAIVSNDNICSYKIKSNSILISSNTRVEKKGRRHSHFSGGVIVMV